MNTNAPFFNRYFASSLYELDAFSGAVGWVGFVWQGADPPPSLSFEASFTSGYYLFAPSAPTFADEQAATDYALKIKAWLADNFNDPFLGYACLWLPDANGPVFGDDPAQCAITFSQGGGGTVSTASDFNLHAGQLTFSVPAQTVLGVDARGLVFRANGAGQIDFLMEGAASTPSVDGDSYLPFVGAYAGAFIVAGTLLRSGEHNTLNGFETGFHYLHRATDGLKRQVYPVIVSGPAKATLSYTGTVDPLNLFNSQTVALPPGILRTQFALTGADALPSWYRTPTGRPIVLIPLNGLDADGQPSAWCSALVLQPKTPAGAPVDAVYMTLAGDYAMAEANPVSSESALQFMPGLYGSERVLMTPWQSAQPFDRLRFVPGQAANAPVFPYAPANMNAPDIGKPKPRLDSTYVTAWAAVLNGAEGHACYLAQPEGSPLYAPACGASSGSLALLAPLPTPSPISQCDAAGALVLLPLVPYAGIGTTPIENLAAFESQILSSVRKDRLGALGMPRVAALKNARNSRLRVAGVSASTHQATTPQGLYADVEVPSQDSPESLYHRVVVARSIAKLPATGSVDFAFNALKPEVQNLFQTNQLMAVVVNSTKLGAPVLSAPVSADAATFERDVVIADWRMTAAVGDSLNSTSYSNILIMKYCDGTLLERLRNPNKWVDVGTFSVSAGNTGNASVALTGLSTYLQRYLEAGIAAADHGNDLYQDFARIVQDPDWQGFIVLAADVDPSGFPDQIKGLVGGIDFTQFRAHHFGATASRVDVSGTSVTVQTPSSLFGLIDYELPAYKANVAAGGSPDMPVPIAGSAEFGFQVLQLQTLFRNAALVDFRSHVQLTVNQLFLSPVVSAYGAVGQLPAQAVVLKGSYQRQGETGVYVFEQNATTRFLLNSNVLPSVALQRVVFNTLSSGDEPGGDGIVRSRFLMSGSLEFAMLSVAIKDQAAREIDLLSFGAQGAGEPTAAAAGLSFSGLDVSMSSPVDAPNAVTFAFEANKLALDQGASQPRPHSLFTDLALQVDGFIVGAEDKRPIDFGFLPVGVEPKVKALSGPWFGVTYNVTMGSPGGLVSQAGFSSRMLLAWAPTSLSRDTTTSVFTGLQLPGAAPGAKLFSIQGVLKLSIDSLLLRREQVTGEEYSFTLRLNNVGLTFLGIVKLPPGATINFFLFGDPAGTGSLGWYAAYVEDRKTQLSAIQVVPQGHETRLGHEGQASAENVS
ncbi:hypothetical protein BLL37_31175 [Pseudomonas azotoformans]|uniref:Uncharacterized protein n=1 Tax=Pseudomonas azotoformans TaxID=47878 RepID=A0A1V2J315_PSEAZ|nr:hypothetical protein [Pseudomonas azotoformans]OIN45259.1 hypothetical protein BFL39_24460 [Pseudomonas azotoformans]ONH39823.1 hypothetical protein BLL37_31175 [Pseudomonas azotoformans]SDM97663.1 hypothetical protein SAMN04489799_0734 [Pseudomonas azotoformans]